MKLIGKPATPPSPLTVPPRPGGEAKLPENELENVPENEQIKSASLGNFIYSWFRSIFPPKEEKVVVIRSREWWFDQAKLYNKYCVGCKKVIYKEFKWAVSEYDSVSGEINKIHTEGTCECGKDYSYWIRKIPYYCQINENTYLEEYELERLTG